MLAILNSTECADQCGDGAAKGLPGNSFPTQLLDPDMPTRTIDATTELAAFLRNRRESLNPADLGLPERRQSRRTPGLRREEVAELAGVSVDYVVRLEQARGLRPSAEVVEALAGALRLSPGERVYLYDLSQQRPRRAAEPVAFAGSSLARLVSDLSPQPALLLNRRYDILAWNPEAAALLTDFDALPASQRNLAWLCLRHPKIRDYYVDRERVVREGVASLRAAWAAHPDDQRLNDLLDEFFAQVEDFARFWDEADATVRGRGQKTVRHPVAGEITLDFEMLTPLQDPDQQVLIFRGAGEADRQALRRLL